MPDIHRIAEQYDGKMKFCSLDTTENRRLEISQKVIGLPTLLYTKMLLFRIFAINYKQITIISNKYESCLLLVTHNLPLNSRFGFILYLWRYWSCPRRQNRMVCWKNWLM